MTSKIDTVDEMLAALAALALLDNAKPPAGSTREKTIHAIRVAETRREIVEALAGAYRDALPEMDEQRRVGIEALLGLYQGKVTEDR